MSASISYRPLFVNGDAPYCSLLKIDDCTILLDCGWNDKYDPEDLEILKSVVNEIDCVLLTFPLVEHLGALPYLVGKLGLSVPIYATTPVKKLGELAMYEACIARGWDSPNVVEVSLTPEGETILTTNGVSVVSNMGGRPRISQSDESSIPWDLDCVDKAFSQVIPVEYQREIRLSGKGAGIVVAPFAAGRTLGGCFWKLSKEGNECVYAVGYHHGRERHVGGGVMETAIDTPAIVITDADLAMGGKAVARRERDNTIINNVLAAINSGGSVIIPIESAARALEILLLLESISEPRPAPHPSAPVQNPNAHSHMCYLDAPIVFASAVSDSIIATVKNMVEWASRDAQLQLHTGKQHPFAFPHVRTAVNLVGVQNAVSSYYRERGAHRSGREPAVVLAAEPSLRVGLAAELLRLWGPDANTLVLLTTRSQHTRWHTLKSSSSSSGLAGAEAARGGAAVASPETAGSGAGAAMSGGTMASSGASPVPVDAMQHDLGEAVYARAGLLMGYGDSDTRTSTQAVTETTARTVAAQGDLVSSASVSMSPGAATHATAGGAFTALATAVTWVSYARCLRERLNEEEALWYEQACQWLQSQATMQAGEGESEEETDEEISDEEDDVERARGSAHAAAQRARARGRKAQEREARALFLQFASQRRAVKRYDAYGEVQDGPLTLEHSGIVGSNGGVHIGAGGMGGQLSSGSITGPGMAKREREAETSVDIRAEQHMQKRNKGDGDLRVNHTAPCEFSAGDTPHKLQMVASELRLLCRALFVDLQGRSDAPSVRTVVSKMKPQKLVLCHGSLVARQHLARDVRAATGCEIHVPAAGEHVHVSMDSAVHQLLLQESLYKGLRWNKVGECLVARLRGKIAPTEEWAAGMPVIASGEQVVGSNATKNEEAVFIGEVMLADVKEVLNSYHIPADLYGGGVLVCGQNGSVEVFKANGQLVVEGMIGEDLYRIREIVYGQFKLV